MQLAMVGLDLAKHVFQLHGVDAAARVVIRRRLRRADVTRFFAAQPDAAGGCLIRSAALTMNREPSLEDLRPWRSPTPS